MICLTKISVFLVVLLVSVGSSLALWAEFPAPPVIKDRVFDVTDHAFGAIADGTTDNTAAIQATIKAAEAAGGIVRIPAAAKTYMCGPITLASGVMLQIEKGATLQMLPYGTYTGTDDFITLADLHDVKISGGGVIDGQGAPWWKAFDEKKIKRPKAMIAIVKSTRVAIEGVTLSNPPNTHVQLRAGSSEVSFVNVTIASPEKAHNTDGIDVSGSNILIDHCKIACGDDNIAIGGSTSANANIVISNCEFGHGHGLSIGSYTSGGLKNLTVENCTFARTMAGIRMKARRDRGGVVENLRYSNITMTDVEKPIFITSYYPDKTIPKNPADDIGASLTMKTPIWRKIIIRNLSAKAAMDNKRCSAGMIWGLPEMPVGELVLENILVSAPAGMVVCNAAISFRGEVRFETGTADAPLRFFNALVITGQPRSQEVAVKGEAVFEVLLAAGQDLEKTVQKVTWTHDGVALLDGRLSDGTEISGANTSRLTLRNISPGGAGIYAATVSAERPSGTKVALTSEPATLKVTPVAK